jgi:hypothetical protein
MRARPGYSGGGETAAALPCERPGRSRDRYGRGPRVSPPIASDVGTDGLNSVLRAWDRQECGLEGERRLCGYRVHLSKTTRESFIPPKLSSAIGAAGKMPANGERTLAALHVCGEHLPRLSTPHASSPSDAVPAAGNIMSFNLLRPRCTLTLAAVFEIFSCPAISSIDIPYTSRKTTAAR